MTSHDPRDRRPPSRAGWYALGALGILVAFGGQFLWDTGRTGAGLAVVAVGGAMVIGALLRVALGGEPKPPRR